MCISPVWKEKNRYILRSYIIKCLANHVKSNSPPVQQKTTKKFISIFTMFSTNSLSLNKMMFHFRHLLLDRASFSSSITILDLPTRSSNLPHVFFYLKSECLCIVANSPAFCGRLTHFEEWNMNFCKGGTLQNLKTWLKTQKLPHFDLQELATM